MHRLAIFTSFSLFVSCDSKLMWKFFEQCRLWFDIHSIERDMLHPDFISSIPPIYLYSMKLKVVSLWGHFIHYCLNYWKLLDNCICWKDTITMVKREESYGLTIKSFHILKEEEVADMLCWLQPWTPSLRYKRSRWVKFTRRKNPARRFTCVPCLRRRVISQPAAYQRCNMMSYYRYIRFYKIMVLPRLLYDSGNWLLTKS
jgi:hypothetical protein